MFIEDARRYARDIDIDNFELEAQLQHNGGETGLIDFTTDYLIALFFACDGNPTKDGRVILLKQDETTGDWIKIPKNPEHRVIAQKAYSFSRQKALLSRANMVNQLRFAKISKNPC